VVKKGIGKGEEKVGTIHLFSYDCFWERECLEGYCVWSFTNFEMKISRVLYHIIVFPKSYLLLELKL